MSRAELDLAIAGAFAERRRALEQRAQDEIAHLNWHYHSYCIYLANASLEYFLALDDPAFDGEDGEP